MQHGKLPLIARTSPSPRTDENLESKISRAPSATLVRGSPGWSERVLELIQRDNMDDLKELCDLMGVSD